MTSMSKGNGRGTMRDDEVSLDPHPSVSGVHSAGDRQAAPVYSDENVGGMYQCKLCVWKVRRDDFMIMTEDAAGKNAPEHDFQGYLWGMCYNCFRGRHQHSNVDHYSRRAKFKDETAARHMFERECKRRHNKRVDVKRADVTRLRTARFEGLTQLMQLMQKEYPYDSTTQRRKKVMEFIRGVTCDVKETFGRLCRPSMMRP